VRACMRPCVREQREGGRERERDLREESQLCVEVQHRVCWVCSLSCLCVDCVCHQPTWGGGWGAGLHECVCVVVCACVRVASENRLWPGAGRCGACPDGLAMLRHAQPKIEEQEQSRAGQVKSVAIAIDCGRPVTILQWVSHSSPSDPRALGLVARGAAVVPRT
jgi:hypothetical protein